MRESLLDYYSKDQNWTNIPDFQFLNLIGSRKQKNWASEDKMEPPAPNNFTKFVKTIFFDDENCQSPMGENLTLDYDNRGCILNFRVKNTAKSGLSCN